MKIVLQLTASDGTSETVTISAGQNFRVPQGTTVEIILLEGVRDLRVEGANLVLSGPDGAIRIAGLDADFLTSTASVANPSMDGPLPDGFLHLLSWGDLPDANTPNKRTDFDDVTAKTTTTGSEGQPPLDYTDRHIGQENPPGATPEITGYSDDTGTVADGITTDTTPTLRGLAEAGATVTIFDGATELGTVAAANDGTWSFTTAALNDGPHGFTVTATNAYGTSTASPATTITVDTEAPGAPTITAFSNDTGAAGDAVTSDTALTLSGTAEAGATITIFDGADELGTATATSGGAWSFDTVALDDGLHSFTATATDAAGNSGLASSALTVAIDTEAPVAPSITDYSSDSGVAGDNITSDTVLTLSGTAEVGATVTIFDGATRLGATTADGGGAWSFDTPTLGNGAHEFTATATDAAGNAGPASAALSVTIDTDAPIAPIITGYSDDSGVVGDGVTSATMLTLSGTAEAGATVAVFDGATELGTATVDGHGAWSFDTTTLGNGVHDFTATATDAAGNTGPASASLSVTIDTNAPGAPVITGFSTDTGVVGDGITSATTLTLSGTAEAGAIVTIFNDATEIGTAIATGGVWNFDTAALADATYSFTATATDAAGNTGDASAALSVTVDTEAPDAPVITGFSTDTGTVGDGITADTTLTLRGTAEAGATVAIFDGAMLLGTAIATGGTWSFDTSTLSSGSHSFTAVATDAAGNAGDSSAALAITIDTSAPVAPEITAFSTDTGTLGDRITSDTALTLSGTAEEGATVTIFDGGIVIGTAVATGGVWSFDTASLDEGSHSFTATATDTTGNTGSPSSPFIIVVDTTPPAIPVITGYSTDTGVTGDGITSDAELTLNGTAANGSTVTIFDGVTEIGTAQVSAGTWSFTTEALPEGAHSFTAVASDAAGNVSTISAVLDIAIDTTAPAAPTLTGFSDDTGATGDGTTSDNTVTFSGTAAAGATVNVYWGATVVASGVADGDGHWSATTLAMADGYYSVEARAVDAAGNRSAPSGPLVVAIDTTAPDAPAITGYSDDTGAVGDALTSDTTLTLTGTAALGTTVFIYDGANFLGSVPVNAGNWSFTTAALDDGAHEFTARSTDAAGNTSDASTTLTVTVDATAPSAPAITGFSNDTGMTGDGQTSDNTITLTGTAGANETVNIYSNGDLVASGIADSGGHWQATTGTLSDGSYYFTARTVDAAGNLSAPTASLPVIIDTDAPDAPVISGFGNDTGIIGDGATNDTTITLTGTAEEGATVTIFDGVTELGTANADNTGAWSFTTAALGSGAHSFTAQAQDMAGNTGSLSAALDLTIDVTPPAIPTITGFSDDSGAVGDGRTSDNTLTFTGTAEAGMIVNVYSGATIVATGVADGDGHWSATTDVLADNYYLFVARAVDDAGNASPASEPIAVFVDTTPPIIPVITGFASDNGVAGDHLTSDSTLTLSGTGDSGAIVTIYDGATQLGTAQVMGGVWSFATAALTEGNHSFTASSTDAAGNTSGLSSAFAVEIDLTPPSVPTITGFSDNSGNPADIYTSDNTITFSGAATAGDVVNVYWGAAIVASGIADETGHWSATTDILADGSYSFVARAADVAGNLSGPSTQTDVTVDTAAPVAPAITGFSTDTGAAGDGLTSDNTLTLSGTGQSGTMIAIYDGATLLGTAIVNGGIWSFGTAILADGAHDFTATATDTAGNTGDASAVYTVTIDTAAPAVPVITGFSNDTGTVGDGTTADNAPTFAGTADAGATISVYWGGTVIASGIADGDGHWSVTSTTLADGYYSLQARATDAAGNASAFSGALVVVVDTTPPAAPVITSFSEDTGTVGDGITSSTVLTLNGTGASGDQITIYDGATLLGTASVSGGTWSFTTGTLANGAHSFTAAATDAAGNTGDVSSALAITIDATPTATPVITGFSEDTGAIGDGQTSDNTITLTGTADAGAIVNIYWSGNIIASGVADGDGNWSVTTGTLADGSYALVARATNGVTSSGFSPTLSISIDTVAPDAPTITGYSNDSGVAGDGVTNDTILSITGTAPSGTANVAVYDGATFLGIAAVGGGNWTFITGTLGEGAHEFTAKAVDGAGNASTASGAFSITIDTTPLAAPAISGAGGYTQDNTPTFTGTAVAGATVNVYLGADIVATAVADGSGNWSATASSPIADGVPSFIARTIDVAGNLSLASAPYTLIIDTVAPAAPVISSFANDSGVAGDGVTNDTILRLSGTTDLGTAQVSIYDGATLIGTANVSGGSWTFDTSVLSQGAHSFTAKATDFAGNTGAASGALAVTIDTVPPAAPVILSSGGYTSDNTPTFTGTAAVGVTVNVYLGGTIVATGVADGAGNWTATATNPITDGFMSFDAQAKDAAGNQSLPSNAVTLIIDTQAPATPTITSFSSDGGVVGDGITNDATLTLSGTAETGTARVAIYDGAALLGTANVNGGAWTFNTATLTQGVHGFTAKAIDSAGNESAATASLDVTIDTSAPAKPTFDAMTTYLTDNTPTFTGTAEIGATVQVYLGGNVIATGIADGTGRWNATSASAIAEGYQSFNARAVDVAGNAGAFSDPLVVIIDTIAPDAPTITGYSEDTGAAGDNITADTTLTLTGTAVTGSTLVTIYDGATRLGTAIVNNGVWTYTTTALADGPHSLTATANDYPGNESLASSPLNVTIDTTAPAAPVITGFSDDTGTPGDGITTDTVLVLNGTAEALARITIRDGATVLGTATADGAGAWSFTTATLTAGGHSFTATASDAAGNTGAGSAPLGVIIQGGDLATPVISGISDDTGTAGDGRTADNTLTFTGTASAGATVAVMWGATIIATGVADGTGHWAATSSALSDGSYTFHAVATDGVATSGPSLDAAIVIDTVGAAAPVIAGISTDTGIVGDGITSDNTLTLSGTCEAGATVQIFDGATQLGTAIVSGTNWTFDTGTLATGGHVFTAMAIDQAGNEGNASSAYSVTIDTAPPAAPVIDAGNYYVNDSTPTITGTAEAGATVNLYLDGAVNLIATVVADDNGQWSATPASTISEGSHYFVARATDAAGNLSQQSQPASHLIDTVAPDTPTIDSYTPDSGVIGDGITNNTYLSLSGTSSGVVASIRVYDGTTLLGTTYSIGGVWSYSTASLAQGTHEFTVKAVDYAGNESTASSPLAVTIDTTAPAAPTIDSQSYYTNDNTPTLTGTATAGATVRLYADGSNTAIVTVTADGTGHWAATVLSPMADGYHSFVARTVDAAGNVSNQSPSSAGFQIDTVATTAPVVTGFSPDTGIVGDGITNSSYLTLTGTAAAGTSSVNIYDGGTLIGSTYPNGGVWSYFTPLLTQGEHNFTAKTVDYAGNVSDASTALAVTVDTAGPAAPTLDATSYYMADNTPTFTGMAEAGTTVNLYLGSTLVGSGVADGFGHWSATVSSPLADGSQSLLVRTMDAAGNSGGYVSASFLIDTQAPLAPTIGGFSPDNGVAGDHITNATSLHLSGTMEAFPSQVSVYDGATFLGYASLAGTNWTFDTQTLAQGVHHFTATVTDYAGNVGAASAALDVTIDTTPPTAPVITTASGATADNTPMLEGTADVGSMIHVLNGGNVVATGIADADGHWSATVSSPVGEGYQSFIAQAFDAAGNASGGSNGLALIVDTIAPSAPAISSISDYNGVLSEGYTTQTVVTLQGTASDAGHVDIYDGVTLLGSAIASGGTWSYQTESLSSGAHDFTATAFDVAGNASSSSSSVSVTLGAFVVTGTGGDGSYTTSGPIGMIDGQGGTDTLHFTGASLSSADLSTVHSIEKIDLGLGAQSFSLTAADILQVSGDIFGSPGNETTRLTITGDSSDTVTVTDGGWTNSGTQTVGSVAFNVFDNGHAQLFVQPEVTTHNLPVA